MKRAITSSCIALAITFSSPAAELAESLEAFSIYQFGDSKEHLHKARLATFRGADEPEVRLRQEQLVLEFLQSDATVDARREAMLWLANLGTTASVPVLETLAEDEDFKDVAAIALAEVQGRRPFMSSGDTETTPPDTDAILSEDERAARMAIEAIAEGFANRDSQAWLLENLENIPPHRRLTALNALLRADESVGVEAAATLESSDDPEVRRAAILALGTHAGAQDIPRFAKWLRSDDPSLHTAARDALVAAPEPAIRGALMEWLSGDDRAMQSKAIEIAAQRGARFAGDELLRVADDSDNPNQESAVAAIAMASPAEMLPAVIDRWTAAAGSRLESEWQSTTWALARRQPDYEAAIQTLQVRASDAPESVRRAIESMAERLESAMPEISLDELRGD